MGPLVVRERRDGKGGRGCFRGGGVEGVSQPLLSVLQVDRRRSP